MISTLIATWNLIMWVRAQKKQLEANAEAYLTQERAAEFRLNTEKIFWALERGNGNFEKLPKVIQWFFSATTADNLLGQFGKWFLKSNKLAIKSKELDTPIYQVH